MNSKDKLLKMQLQKKGYSQEVTSRILKMYKNPDTKEKA
jgi:hypothetical protein